LCQDLHPLPLPLLPEGQILPRLLLTPLRGAGGASDGGGAGGGGTCCCASPSPCRRPGRMPAAAAGADGAAPHAV